jgi:hypothetical protein
VFVPGKPFQLSLLREKHKFIMETVNYDRNKFYDTRPWGLYYKTVLEMFVWGQEPTLEWLKGVSLW